MRTKINKCAKELIAGNFANFHRHGWGEVESILREKEYFKNQLEIKNALNEAFAFQSVEKLNALMVKFEIQSVYPLPKISKLN